MGRDREAALSHSRYRADKPCCHEVLAAALAGLFPAKEGLEVMLDHLERTA